MNNFIGGQMFGRGYDAIITVQDVVDGILRSVNVGDIVPRKEGNGVRIENGVSLMIMIYANHTQSSGTYDILYDRNGSMITSYFENKRSVGVANPSIQSIKNFDLSKINHISKILTKVNYTAAIDVNGNGELNAAVCKSFDMNSIKCIIHLDGIRLKKDLTVANVPNNKKLGII